MVSSHYYQKNEFIPASQRNVTFDQFHNENIQPLFSYIDRLEQYLSTKFYDQAKNVISLRRYSKINPLESDSEEHVSRLLTFLRQDIRDELNYIKYARYRFNVHLHGIERENLDGSLIRVIEVGKPLDETLKLYEHVHHLKKLILRHLERPYNSGPIYYIYPPKKKRPVPGELQSTFQTLRTLKYTFDNQVIFTENFPF